MGQRFPLGHQREKVRERVPRARGGGDQKVNLKQNVEVAGEVNQRVGDAARLVVRLVALGPGRGVESDAARSGK